MTGRPSAGRWSLWLGVLVAAIFCAAPIRAEDATAPLPQPPATATATAKPSPWEFEAEPYGWLFGNYGSVTVKGRSAQFSVSPIDFYQLLEDGNAFAGAGYFSVGYDRFSLFADSAGGYAQESVNETIPTQLCALSLRARDKVKFVITDVGLGYRVGQWSLPGRQRPLTLGVYAGTRYMFFRNELHATAGVIGAAQHSADVSESFDWADPLLGIRWSVPVLDSVSFDFRGDIGGFGASSDLIWGIVGSVRYWIPWTPMATHPYLAAGYRVVDFERSGSVGNIGLQFRGPAAGLGFVF